MQYIISTLRREETCFGDAFYFIYRTYIFTRGTCIQVVMCLLNPPFEAVLIVLSFF